jgi:hypothetical protein
MSFDELFCRKIWLLYCECSYKKKKSTAYRTDVKTVFVFHLLTVGSRLLVNDGSVAVDKQLVSCKWLIYPPLLQISQIISLKNCFDVSRTRY